MSFVPAFGRWEDRESTEKFFASQPKLSLGSSAIMEADDDRDVDLCDIYKEVTGLEWDDTDQNPNGTCVGHGNKKAVTMEIACQVKAGLCSWPGADAAIEPIYGGMRFEIGAKKHGSNLNRGGDGGVGTWAAEWLLEYGVLFMQQYGSIDLTNYDKQRVLQWGRSGVPDELEPVARQKPLKQALLMDDEQQCWSMIGQLRPLVHCSNQGFSMRRNSNGTCDANDTWPHCSIWDGRFTLQDGTKTLRYGNSWNGGRHRRGYLGDPIVVQGKYGPIKLSGCQFLVPLRVVGNMCRSGRETFAFIGVDGLEKRRELFLI